MASVESAMKRIIDYCDICLYGYPISRELLTKEFTSFVSSTIEKADHNYNVILHTGSLCFEALLLSYVALSNIFYNCTTSEDIVISLKDGDPVIYKGERYIFREIIRGEKLNKYSDCKDFIILEQPTKHTREAAPKELWNKISPYNGSSHNFDGRGIKKETGIRNDFFEEVLEIPKNEIPITIDTSTVFVMQKHISDELVQGLSYRFSGKEIKLLELVTASYYTDINQEYNYGGNVAKVEPVIKIASKVSTARALLLKRDGNKNIGLVVFGDDLIQRGQFELPELIQRRSIQYVYICTNIDSNNRDNILNYNSDINLFACTKDFLMRNPVDLIENNIFTNLLQNQINNILNHTIITEIIDDLISWDDYVKFKRSMLILKKSDFDSKEKDEFIIQSFSLMNLFLSSAYPILDIDKNSNEIFMTKVITVQKKLENLNCCLNGLPDYLKPTANSIMVLLTSIYDSLKKDNKKYDKLKEIVRYNRDKKVCVVVPKLYQVELVKSNLNFSDCEVVSINKFDNNNLYDLIICVGDFSGNRFDTFRCKSSKRIVILLYKAEEYQFLKRQKNAEEYEHRLNMMSMISVDDNWRVETAIYDESVIDEIIEIDLDIDRYIDTVSYKSINTLLGEGTLTSTSDVVAFAKFDTDEVAFFTKNYKAYVLDPIEMSIMETKVEDLAEGDTIVFTRSNSRTRDIVDEILQEMIEKDDKPQGLDEAYILSKLWKYNLSKYMNDNSLTPTEVAKKMLENGAGVHEITIKSWLDEDSHTVGPRDIESIRQIALIIDDKDMWNDAEKIFNACAYIRKVRRKILDSIGKTILYKLAGKTVNTDSVLLIASERIEEISIVLKIDQISEVDEKIATGLINRPLSL